MKGGGSCDSEMCQAFLGIFLGGVVHTPPLTSGSASSQISSAHLRQLLETTWIHHGVCGALALEALPHTVLPIYISISLGQPLLG